jgi:hypothetical protein
MSAIYDVWRPGKTMVAPKVENVHFSTAESVEHP